MFHPNRTVAARFLIGALASASLTLDARATASDPFGAAPEPSVRIAEICQSVLRLRRREAHYDACVSSLSDSLRSAGQDHALRELRYGCLDQGLAPGGATLAECVLRSSGEKPTTSGSFFYASPAEVSRRERLSCARLGFDPATGAFTDCVSDLAAALDPIDPPE